MMSRRAAECSDTRVLASQVNKSALDSLQSIPLWASLFGTTTGKVESLAIAGGEFIGTPIRQLICRMPYADYGELFLRTRVNKGERKAWGAWNRAGTRIEHRPSLLGSGAH